MATNSPFSYLDIVVEGVRKAGEYLKDKSSDSSEAVGENVPPRRRKVKPNNNNKMKSGTTGDKSESATVGDTDPNAPKPKFSQGGIDGGWDSSLTEAEKSAIEKGKPINRYLADVARYAELGDAKVENSLNEFASKNYLWTFAALSNDEVNFPDTTYRTTGPKSNQTIIKMGGGGIEQRPQTELEKSQDPDPRFRSASGRTSLEYFINNVEIKSNIAPNPKSRATNAFQIDFEVQEPYSMGQFLQHMQLCALQAGYNNYLECPFLLQLNVEGFTDVGFGDKPLLGIAPLGIPGGRRQIAIKIHNIEFDVNEGGSRYTIQAAPFNEEALNDQAQNIPQNISISGRDLKEICQTGVNSLASVVNTALLETAKKIKSKHEPDEIIILFPNETTEFQLSNAVAEADNTAVFGDFASERREINYNEALKSAIGVNFQKQASQYGGMDGAGSGRGLFMAQRDYVNNRLGFSIKRNALSEKIKSTFMTDEFTNDIARKQIFTEGSLQPGTTNFATSSFAYNDKTKILSRGATSIDPKQRTIQFKSGTKIQRIIEELVLISDFGKDLVNKGQITADPVTGMVKWFKIETSVFVLDAPLTENLTNRHPRIYVYKVVPYDVHQSVFMLPGDPPPGYQFLRTQACKHYDYIYTGQNDDILNFDINFKNAFFTAIAGDFGNTSANNDTASRGLANNQPKLGVPEHPGLDVKDPKSAYMEFQQTRTEMGSQTRGAVQETPAVRVARAFQDALVNSPSDLINASLTIMGDLYYLTDSGTGNYNSKSSQFINLTQDGTMNYQNSSVDIIINFKTPIDIDVGGAKGLNTKTVKQFSGLYTVYEVTSSFRDNQFVQELAVYRRPNQDLTTDTNITAKLLEVKKAHQKLIDEASTSGDPEAFAHAQADADMNGRITGLERPAYDAYLKRAKAEYAEYEKAKQEYDLTKLLEQQQSEYEKAAFGDGRT